MATKRRAEPVGIIKKKLKFDDGTGPSSAREAILNPPNASGAIQKVIDIVNGPPKGPPNTYEYSPLGPGEDIRVLIVEPGLENESIKCDLVPSALPSTRRGPHLPKVYNYEALSYYWGQDEPTTPITIRSRVSKKGSEEKLGWGNIFIGKFHIRKNLHGALLQLRHPYDRVVLWVDALCINQQDPDEKNMQVQRMHEIYSEAVSVCVWLGVGDPGRNHDTFEFIRTMLDLTTLDQLIESSEAVDRWLSLIQLMRNRWFSRRWVVQELALARSATVHCGSETITWGDFADAVALFGMKHDTIKKLLKSARPSEVVGDMRALGANTLVDLTNNLFRKSDQGKILERLSSLEVLVSILLAFEATDPKDTIYAVLSIAKDTPYSFSDAASPICSAISMTNSPPDHRIIPDYTKSLRDIFTDFIDYCIDTSKSLDIICRHWAPMENKTILAKLRAGPEIEDKMPSWIPSISGSAFGDPQTALRGRINGDSLVGTPSRQNLQYYNASAGLKPWVKFGRVSDVELPTNNPEKSKLNVEATEGDASRMTSDTGHTRSSSPHRDKKIQRPKFDGTLYVKGCRLDVISRLSQRVTEGTIFKECLEMGGWSDVDTSDSVPEALWRTLVADRGDNGINTPSWYHRACIECLTHITPNGHLITSNLMALNSTMVVFLERVQRVTWERKFLNTKGNLGGEEKKPHLGLAPPRAQEGDIVCILYGCCVPVVLREYKTMDDHYFEFIGESYIHGMMDGEALANKNLEHPYHDSEVFKLR